MSQICKWKNFKSECLKIFSINLQFSVTKMKTDELIFKF